LKTDHWFYGLFQSAPDLVALPLPAAGAADAAVVPNLGPDAPGDALYRFDAPKLKAANHRLDRAFLRLAMAVVVSPAPQARTISARCTNECG